MCIVASESSDLESEKNMLLLLERATHEIKSWICHKKSKKKSYLNQFWCDLMYLLTKECKLFENYQYIFNLNVLKIKITKRFFQIQKKSFIKIFSFFQNLCKKLKKFMSIPCMHIKLFNFSNSDSCKYFKIYARFGCTIIQFIFYRQIKCADELLICINFSLKKMVMRLMRCDL